MIVDTLYYNHMRDNTDCQYDARTTNNITFSIN